MVRNLILLFIAILISSGCMLFNKFTLKTCEDNSSYQLIDTAAFYLLTETYRISETTSAKVEIEYHAPKRNGIKFYKNGRAAFFNNIHLDNPSSLNPKNASKGLYCFKGKDNQMEFRHYSVQSRYFLSKEEVELRGDTLITRSQIGSGFSSKYTYVYIKIKIPKEALVFTPDW